MVYCFSPPISIVAIKLAFFVKQIRLRCGLFQFDRGRYECCVRERRTGLVGILVRLLTMPLNLDIFLEQKRGRRFGFIEPVSTNNFIMFFIRLA